MSNKSFNLLKYRKDFIKKNFNGVVYSDLNGEYVKELLHNKGKLFNFLNCFHYDWGEGAHLFEDDEEGYSYELKLEKNKGMIAKCHAKILFTNNNGKTEVIASSTIIDIRYVHHSEKCLYAIESYNNSIVTNGWNNWILNNTLEEIEEMLVSGDALEHLWSAKKVYEESTGYGVGVNIYGIFGQFRNWASDIDWDNMTFTWEKIDNEDPHFELKFLYSFKSESKEMKVNIYPKYAASNEDIISSVCNPIIQMASEWKDGLFDRIDFKKYSPKNFPVSEILLNIESVVMYTIAHVLANINDERLQAELNADHWEEATELKVKIVENNKTLICKTIKLSTNEENAVHYKHGRGKMMSIFIPGLS